MKNFLTRNLPIISIILVGAFLRMFRLPEYVIFLGDEGRDAIAVYNILHGHLTLLGPTASVGGFFLGPIYYYLMAPFFFLSHYHPAGPGYMVAFFGLATIYLIYWLGKNFFNEKVGLISAFLYSIAPIIIFYSRSSWNPNVLPFFTLASLIMVYKALERNSKLLFILTGFLLGICLQLHYLATFLGVSVFLYVLVNLWQVRKNLAEFFQKFFYTNCLMFLGFLVGFAPFLLFEARHGFQNTQNVIKFIFNSPDTGVGNHLGYTLVFVTTRLFDGLVFNFPISINFPLYSKEAISLWSGFGFICAIAGFILIFSKIQRTNLESFRKYTLLLVWGIVGILLFTMYKKTIYDYYLAFLFPLPFILMGNLSYTLATNKKSFIAFCTGLFVIVFSFSSSIAFAPIKIEPNNQYNQVKTIAESILSKTEGKPFNFALLSKGNSDYAYRFIFKVEGNEAKVLETPLTDPSGKTVMDQLFVLCDYKDCSPQGNPLWEVAGFGQAKIVGEWETSVGKLYKLVHDNPRVSTRK